MRIGIIGAGQIGGTLTRRLAALGHDVRVSNSRTPDTLAELEAETGAKAVRSTEAAEGAELVIVSIPQKNVVDLPAGILSGAVAGAPVIETNLINQLGFDPVDAGTIDDSWRQQPGTPVYGKDFDREATLKALAEASPDRTDEWRATTTV